MYANVRMAVDTLLVKSVSEKQKCATEIPDISWKERQKSTPIHFFNLNYRCFSKLTFLSHNAVIIQC